MESKFDIAISQFDKANKEDPNKELFDGKEYSKELLYSIRLTDTLNKFCPDASETLKLAIRCQHICRWEIPRSSYEMNRVGYLSWRKDLKKFHAEKSSEILNGIGYSDSEINEVSSLLLKKDIKGNKDAQILEDVVCLVFLEFNLPKFSEKYAEEKLIDIISKTWAKMSEQGHESALKIKLDENLTSLISKAIG